MNSSFSLFLIVLGIVSQISCGGAKTRPVKINTNLKSPESASRCSKIEPIAKKVSNEMGIEHSLLMGLIKIESNFNPDVRSSHGAVGLMQIMPSTARSMNCKDVHEPYQNIQCGAKILKELLLRYNNNVILSLAGYNSGPFHSDRAQRDKKLPNNFSYVEQVLSARARHILNGCDF